MAVSGSPWGVRYRRSGGQEGIRMYRVYADGREFGIDYDTLADALEARAVYASDFPQVRYYIRKIG